MGRHEEVLWNDGREPPEVVSGEHYSYAGRKFANARLLRFSGSNVVTRL